MAIKVKAVERKLKFTKNENAPGVYRYVLGGYFDLPDEERFCRPSPAAMPILMPSEPLRLCWARR